MKKGLALTRGMIILVVAMAVVIVAAVGVGIWALTARSYPVITPDYAPPELEENAEKIEGDEGGKLVSAEGGGAVAIQFTKSVTVDLSDKTAELNFGNPSRSNQQMVVQIWTHDECIAQSGALKPGYKVSKLDLLPGAVNKFAGVGGYEGMIKIINYDENTGEKAMVEIELPLVINVVQ